MFEILTNSLCSSPRRSSLVLMGTGRTCDDSDTIGSWGLSTDTYYRNDNPVGT